MNEAHVKVLAADLYAACEIDYPIELPTACIGELVGIIRRGAYKTEYKAFVKHSYVVIGYLLGKFVGEADADNTVGAIHQITDEPTDEDVCVALENLDPYGPKTAGGVPLPLWFLAKFLLRKLLEMVLD